MISGTILKRALSGKLNIISHKKQAMDVMMLPSFEETGFSLPYDAESKLVQNLKTIFLILSGAAVQKYQTEIKEE